MKILFVRERMIFFVFLAVLCLHSLQQLAQCPSVFSKTDITTEVSLDNFGDIIGGKTVNAALLNVTAGAGCIWDLYANNAAITTISTYPSGAGQGAPLALANINVRAVNGCSTPDHAYIADATRITGTLSGSFAAGNPNYIVGTSGLITEEAAGTPCAYIGGGGLIEKNIGACSDGICDGLGGTILNGTGSPAATPNTHTFRIEVQVLPGLAPIVTPGLYRLDIEFFVEQDASGVVTPPSLIYSLAIEIQPILQLKMNTSSQIDFVFSDVKEYNAGIVKYGATILEVNSSLEWDLMAVGTSNDNESSAGANFFWDNPVSYSPGCVAPNNQIPLEALELKQTPANPSGSGADVDYSPAFTLPPAYSPPAGDGGFLTGTNNIEVGIFPYGVGNFSTGNAAGNLKTIAGNWGNATGPPANSMDAGSYQIPPNSTWNAGFRYVIDYRLVPGLPVTFGGFMTNYACPGVYTMQVKYILAEDQ